MSSSAPQPSAQPGSQPAAGAIPLVFRFTLPLAFIPIVRGSSPMPQPQTQADTTPSSAPSPSTEAQPSQQNTTPPTPQPNASNAGQEQLRFTLFFEVPLVIGNGGIPLGAFANLGQAAGGFNLNDFLNYTFLMQQQQRSGPPPASKSVLEKLGEIKVTDEHTQAQTQCSVCQEALAAGESAVGLPCDHLYHKDCITPWLKEHNTCPTCRYELPTDDAEYEKGRVERMKKREAEQAAKRQRQSEHHHDHRRCEIGRMQNEDCVLLQTSDGEQPATVELECGHSFHAECLDTWCNVAGSGRCPSCRKSVAFPECPLVNPHKKRRVEGNEAADQTPSCAPTADAESNSMDVSQVPLAPPIVVVKDGMELAPTIVNCEPESRPTDESQDKMVLEEQSTEQTISSA